MPSLGFSLPRGSSILRSSLKWNFLFVWKWAAKGKGLRSYFAMCWLKECELVSKNTSKFEYFFPEIMGSFNLWTSWWRRHCSTLHAYVHVQWKRIASLNGVHNYLETFQKLYRTEQLWTIENCLETCRRCKQWPESKGNSFRFHYVWLNIEYYISVVNGNDEFKFKSQWLGSLLCISKSRSFIIKHGFVSILGTSVLALILFCGRILFCKNNFE